jgi:hypothetical protein
MADDAFVRRRTNAESSVFVRNRACSPADGGHPSTVVRPGYLASGAGLKETASARGAMPSIPQSGHPERAAGAARAQSKGPTTTPEGWRRSYGAVFLGCPLAWFQKALSKVAPEDGRVGYDDDLGNRVISSESEYLLHGGSSVGGRSGHDRNWPTTPLCDVAQRRRALFFVRNRACSPADGGHPSTVVRPGHLASGAGLKETASTREERCTLPPAP